LKRPVIIKTSGRITHCEVDFLAGQRKETRGKVGEEELSSAF
jgi:hypothetical protein